MSRVYTTIDINKPADAVFNYVTTPANWPKWHPSSLAVTAAGGTAPDHSLEVGEQATEDYLVAGRRGRVVWTVRQREAPVRWVIDGQIQESKSGGTVSYHLSSHGNGTTFEREFTYTIPNLLLDILDRLVYNRRVQAESAEALRRLKRLLESQ